MTSTIAVHSADGLSEIVVEPGSPVSSDERTTLLVDELYQVVEALNQSVAAQDTRTIVDVRIGDDLPAAARVSVAAFIAGIKGTIQSLTLELPPESPAVNLLVSNSGQESDRERTKQYLRSTDGGYSLGTTYDLRGQNA